MGYPVILSYGQHIHEEIDDERHRQEQMKAAGRFSMTCADPDMSNGARLAVLGEEFGEVCRAILEKRIDGEESFDKHGKELRTELVQVAAVCVAWIQGLDAAQSNVGQAPSDAHAGTPQGASVPKGADHA